MRQRKDVQVRQDGINFIRSHPMQPESQITAPFLAQVTGVYSERMTCDVKTMDGQKIYNLPVLTHAGLIDGKVYGDFELPAVDDYVLVMFGSYGRRHKVVIGTFIPYLTNEFSGAAVNSDSKQFTTKLLEADKLLDYRKIFKSGTTLHVEEDGSITVETPSGTYIRIDETTGEVKVQDQHGNIIAMDSSGVAVDDANGNNITMGTSSVTVNGNLEVLQ